MKIDIVDVNTTIRIVLCLPQRDPKGPVGFKSKRNTNWPLGTFDLAETLLEVSGVSGQSWSITWVLRRPQTAPRATKWTPVAPQKFPETPKVSPEHLQNGIFVSLMGPKWVPRRSQRGTSGTCWIGILFSAKFFVQFWRFLKQNDDCIVFYSTNWAS